MVEVLLVLLIVLLVLFDWRLVVQDFNLRLLHAAALSFLPSCLRACLSVALVSAGCPAVLAVVVILRHLVWLDDVLVDRDLSDAVADLVVDVSALRVLLHSCSRRLDRHRSLSDVLDLFHVFLDLRVVVLVVPVYLVAVDHVIHVYLV